MSRTAQELRLFYHKLLGVRPRPTPMASRRRQPQPREKEERPHKKLLSTQEAEGGRRGAKRPNYTLAPT